MLYRVLPFLLVVAGCPDPTAAPEGGGMSDKPMDGMGGPPPGGEGGQPGMGGPPPGGGQPGGEGGAPSGRPTPPGFQVTPGEGVKLSGTLLYTGSKTGTITIDFLKQGENTNFPDLVHSLTLEKPGPWEVEVPKDAGEFWIVSFIDANGNGPDQTEPAGRVPNAVKVGSESISGLDISVADEPDLGELKPGGKDGAGPGAAPGGGAPGAPPMQGGEMKPGEMPPPPGGEMKPGEPPPGGAMGAPPKDK